MVFARIGARWAADKVLAHRVPRYNCAVMQIVFDMLAHCSRPFLIVGGHALAAHGVVRQTIDIDCLIAAEDEEIFEANLTAGGYVPAARSETRSQQSEIRSQRGSESK
jgi:hypothetical protein